MRSLILCAAVDDELASLLPWLRPEGEGLRGRIHEVEVRAAAIGVGPVDAALGAAAVFRGQRADAAVLLGTCGAFPSSGLELGGAVVVERSILTASDAATGRSYVPPLAAAPALAEPGLVRRLSAGAGIPAVSCATVAAITSSAEEAKALSSFSGCQVEHMEAHAFLRAAELAQIPAACLLGVANEVGPLGHEQWKTHGAAASAAAIDHLLRGIAAL